MAGKITVGRVYKDKLNCKNIKIDRSSPLGNPFYMKDESKRDEVCDKYESYFQNKVKEAGKFREEVVRIYTILKEGSDVNLQCWCSPKSVTVIQ